MAKEKEIFIEQNTCTYAIHLKKWHLIHITFEDHL